MLTEAERQVFERDGILRIPGAFEPRAAARMVDVMWNELRGRHGIDRDDRSTWDRHEPTGMKSSKKSRAFDPILSPVVAEVLDDLLGVGWWDRPRTFGNVLITMPNAAEWRVPHRVWHSDFEATAPVDSLFAVKLWALCSEVESGGGGTPQLAGSHRLFARYLEAACPDRSYKPAKEGFLRSHRWLKELTSDRGEPDRNARFLGVEVDIDGLPARVIETVGAPGDVYVTHAWVFHSIATNAAATPRFMRSVGIRRRPPPDGGRTVR